MDGFQFQDVGAPVAHSGDPEPLAPVPTPRSRRGMLAVAGLLAGAAMTLVLTQVTGARADQAPEVRQVVKTYETAIMRGDGEAACAQLTSSAVQEMLRASASAGQGNSCAAFGVAMKRYVDTLIAQAPSPAKAAEARRMIQDPPVEVVSVDGDGATARISGTSDKPIHLVRRDGRWKIAGFSFPG